MALVDEHGTHLRQHNTDYLLDRDPGVASRCSGIHAANIAPEYGVEETLGLLAAMEGRGAARPQRAVPRRSRYDTRKWEKWELAGSGATDRDRAIWAGHYVFSTPEFAADPRRPPASAPGLTDAELDARLRNHASRRRSCATSERSGWSR